MFFCQTFCSKKFSTAPLTLGFSQLISVRQKGSVTNSGVKRVIFENLTFYFAQTYSTWDKIPSIMNPGGWEKTKNMNISQKRQIYYKVLLGGPVFKNVDHSLLPFHRWRSSITSNPPKKIRENIFSQKCCCN